MEYNPAHAGFFIAFEGLDGSGSEHHAAALARFLLREGYRVVQRHEPTDSMIGGLIRARLAGEWTIAPETLQLLFTADRAEHLRTTIEPALEAGKIVICDRYILSALAYNVVLVNDPNWLKALNARFMWPDLTFVIRVDPRLAVRRVKEARMELDLTRELRKLKQVWTAYEQLVGEYPNVHVIDGERDDVAIMDELIATTQRVLVTRKA